MFKRNFIKSFIFLFFFFSSVCKSAFSEDSPRTQIEEIPISVSSDTMTVHGLEDRALFEGNVLITQGDLQIKADRSQLYMAEPVPPHRSASPASGNPDIKGARAITRIEVSGHVAIQQGNRHATAEQGVYDREKNAIILMGNPEAWEGDYRVRGKTITFFRAQKRFWVDEGRMVIYPKQKGHNK